MKEVDGAQLPDVVTGRKHFVTLDGLRGVAAICVIVFHYHTVFGGNILLPHAFLAVDFFFLLSGLVVAHAYGEALETGKMPIVEFVRRRAIRLYPLIALGALLGAAFWIARRSSPLYLELIWTGLSLLALPWLGRDIQNGGIAPINPPAWSLFYELSANLVYALIAKLLRPWLLAAIVLFAWCALAYLSYKADTLGLGQYSNTLPFGFARVIFSFFFGVAIERSFKRHHNIVPKVPGWILVFALICTFFPARYFHAASQYELLCVTLIYPLIVVLGAASIDGHRVTSAMHLSGELSYPLYILHMPIFHWLSAGINRTYAVPNIAKFLMCVLFVVIAAFLAARKYDEPTRRKLSGMWLAKP